MLREIRLRNLAIAEDASARLGSGLNVLSGSTGAGKSLLVEAVRWLRGERVDQGLIREGADTASAEAVFDLGDRDDLLERLADQGLDEPEDGVLRLRREVRRGGRSRAFVDGNLTSAAHLSALCDSLIEIQSQHQQTTLLDPTYHVHLLDQCGVSIKIRTDYRDNLNLFRECSAAVAEWERERDRIRDQRELLDYQWRELDGAGLQSGEMQQLRERVALMAGGARLVEDANHARELLETEETGAAARLGAAASQLSDQVDQIDALRAAHEALLGAQELAAEAARELERFIDGAQLDPASLDADQARLAELEGLARKYARTEDELVALRDRLAAQVDVDEWGDTPPLRLTEPMEAARGALESSADALHKERARVARRAGRESRELLAELGMPQAELAFELAPRVDPEGPIQLGSIRVTPRTTGSDEVRLVVRTNRGERMGPVERVASGGELSRLGLVLRSLSVRDRAPALIILDEVDAGLGADMGPAMARRLGAMADAVQLLVLSHLPAVAAAATRHLVAHKTAHGDRTVSHIAEVEGTARVEELSRMIGDSSDTTRRLARRLLQEAASA